MPQIYPHRIRLRGPWECEPTARRMLKCGQTFLSATNLPAPSRITMPCRLRDAGLSGFAGQVRFIRRFGYPGRIDSFERVWLTFAGLSDGAKIVLNGEPLGDITEAICPWARDVTSILQSRNELTVVLETASDAGGLWGEVALEIRRTAFLGAVSAKRESKDGSVRLIASGKIIGKSNTPMDLYLLAMGRTVAYSAVGPTEESQEFLLVSDDLEVTPGLSEMTDCRIELVEGGVIWYSAEVPIP